MISPLLAFRCLARNGVDVDALFRRIESLVVRTLISVEPSVTGACRRYCAQVQTDPHGPLWDPYGAPMGPLWDPYAPPADPPAAATARRNHAHLSSSALMCSLTTS